MVEVVQLTDAGAYLALNNAFARETSFLEPAAWAHLLAQARFVLAIEPALGFVLAFDETADYASPNFLWHKARFDRFIYIDRVVIAQAEHGKGLGKALYSHLFEAAKSEGFTRIVCEVNAVPPNPGSLAFHEQLGFVACGEQVLASDKVVRYFVKSL